jgi:Peptidase family M28
LNTRLVRVAFIVVAPALLALLFSISSTGTLQRAPLDPLFDTASAGAIASELSVKFPSRVPGTVGAEDATLWYRETISNLGLQTTEDIWTADLPDLGEVELHNVVTVVPGRAEEAIVLVAHRDNAGAAAPFGDNASGTAALIEIARGYAPQESAPAPPPFRTLVLLSTDGGAYGGAGAARFVEGSEYADVAIAAVVLDGLGGRGRPRLAIAGDHATSAPRTLVTTAAARVEEQTRVRPRMPSVLSQLVDLGVPFAAGEQGPFLAQDIAALTLTTDDEGDPGVPVGDVPGALAVARLGALGRSAEALVASLDASVGAALRTNATLFLDDRAASGWAVRLTLIVAVVPFVLGLLDLLVRARRHRLPLLPALRGLRARFLVALYAGLVVWVSALLGVFPTGDSLPLPPRTSFVVDSPVSGLAVAAIAFGLGWLAARRRLVADVGPTAEERLAGYTAALAWLAAVAIVTALVMPFALVFVLPSLYAWLWLPLRAGTWPRIALYLAGLLGPIGALLVLGRELGLGVLDTALYVVGLATVGYIPLSSVLLALAWVAAATQLAALAFGRYAPYAGGVASPPPGPFRRALTGFIARRRQTAA